MTKLREINATRDPPSSDSFGCASKLSYMCQMKLLKLIAQRRRRILQTSHDMPFRTFRTFGRGAKNLYCTIRAHSSCKMNCKQRPRHRLRRRFDREGWSSAPWILCFFFFVVLVSLVKKRETLWHPPIPGVSPFNKVA